MDKTRFALTIFLCAYAVTTRAAEKEPTSSGTSDKLSVRVQALVAKATKSLRPLKAGTFEMGDWEAESGRPLDIDRDSRPLHKVTLDRFSMMAYKVTYDDFDVFTDATGKERVNMDEISVEDRAPNRPAGVSWYGAKAYCQWLAMQTNMSFDLPTEAQWEYAARSRGKRVLYATDNGQIDRGRNFPLQWQYGESKPPIPDVGTYPANPVGLSGMSEDTGEWINDWYDENYYKISPKKNPRGPETGTEKVKRGSVGGTAEGSAIVVLRTSSLPQPLDTTYPNGLSYDKRVIIPFPGYSGYKSDTFRCVVNSPHRAVK